MVIIAIRLQRLIDKLMANYNMSNHKRQEAVCGLYVKLIESWPEIL